MKILLCCEHFYPSVGGVQKTIYEIGQRLISFGHQVTVVTSWRADRKQDHIDGIRIHSFKISGNSVKGFSNEMEVGEYQKFLIDSDYDFLLVMAAQQWTFDAMLPVLDKIKFKKLHIPCGYSGFFLSAYTKYFQEMPQFLKSFDHLIYHSNNYRDINFARDHKITNICVIPAAASELEFQNPPAGQVLKDLDISENEFVFISVGIPAFHKGHKEVVKAYLNSKLNQKSALVLVGDYDSSERPKLESAKNWIKGLLGSSSKSIQNLAKKNQDSKKKIIFKNLSRNQVIDLFFNSDLFVFASHIEYSPLVIFECLAAGLPFLSVPVGNVAEIIEWTGAGILCEAEVSDQGRTRVNLKDLTIKMEQLSSDTLRLKELGQRGRNIWEKKFTWEAVTKQILELVNKN